MSGARRMPTLGHGLAAACVLSASGAALIAVLTPWLGSATAARLAIGALGLGYALYAMRQSGERVGRIATVVGWAVVAGAVWLADLPLAAYALAHLGLVWFVRSLYYYSGLLPALADLALTALGAAFAAWAALRSDSAWLPLWCFFLVQAFHVSIPASLSDRPTHAARSVPDDAFARAQRAAEAAVRRMTSATR